MLSFFPRGVLDEILNLIESVSEGFPSYSSLNFINNTATWTGGDNAMGSFSSNKDGFYYSGRLLKVSQKLL